MTISILLPYKENYSPQYAGAVSLFVNDITRVSDYKNDLIIFGNTESKKSLSKNYINLELNKKVLFEIKYENNILDKMKEDTLVRSLKVKWLK